MVIQPLPLPSTATDAPFHLSVSVIQRRTDLFTKAFLDSGSTVNLILTHLWQQLGSPLLDRTPLPLETVLASPLNVLGTLHDLLIEVETLPFRVSFQVVDLPDPIPDWSMIFGRPWMRQAKVVQDWGYNEIQFGTTHKVAVKLFDNDTTFFKMRPPPGSLHDPTATTSARPAVPPAAPVPVLPSILGPPPLLISPPPLPPTLEATTPLHPVKDHLPPLLPTPFTLPTLHPRKFLLPLPKERTRPPPSTSFPQPPRPPSRQVWVPKRLLRAQTHRRSIWVPTHLSRAPARPKIHPPSLASPSNPFPLHTPSSTPLSSPPPSPRPKVLLTSITHFPPPSFPSPSSTPPTFLSPFTSLTNHVLRLLPPCQPSLLPSFFSPLSSSS